MEIATVAIRPIHHGGDRQTPWAVSVTIERVRGHSEYVGPQGRWCITWGIREQ
jgi:hypothetical protein